ncbi:Pyridoxal reductase [Colletotrichum trifolii]|uniref:Pyridoxal reductase n=1 Tax=Colletotrichum trifolii TaxID=5466 RepID=A0A4R8QJU2_COLTR|nr:Pyridoxal reductase [Colletotrichum trifolii]
MSRVLAAKTIAGKAIGPVGYGMMGLTRPWEPTDYSTATNVMKTALQQGANFWNGGWFYGTPTFNSLHLVKHYFSQHPEDADKVVLSIKGAYNVPEHVPDGSPEGIRAAVDRCLDVLGGTKTIDVFQCARVDPKVPIETSVGALADLVREGKIGAIGLSEVGAATIRRAHAVHPIAAVEIELSLFTNDVLRNGVAETCHELGIALVAYSPIGRGFLTGEFRRPEDLPANDMRHHLPRFKPDVWAQNYKLVRAVEKIAERKGVSLARVAVAWVRRQGAVPIPGARSDARVVENCQDVELDDRDMEEIRGIIDTMPIAGERYGGKHEELLNQ